LKEKGINVSGEDAVSKSLLLQSLAKKNIVCDTYALLLLALSKSLGYKIDIYKLPKHVFCRYTDGKTTYTIDTGKISTTTKNEFSHNPMFKNEKEKRLDENGILGLAYFNRACAYLYIKSTPQKAFPDLNKAKKLLGNDLDIIGNFGVANFFSGKYKEAIPFFIEIKNKNPDYYKIDYWLGTAYGYAGNSENTEKHFKQAISLDPNSAGNYIGFGLSCFMSHNNEAAITLFNKAILLDQKNSLVYLYRGAARMNQQDYHGALDDFNQSIKLDPYCTKDTKAEAYFNRAVVIVNLVILREMDNSYLPEVITDLNKVIAIDPENKKARELLSQIVPD